MSDTFLRSVRTLNCAVGLYLLIESLLAYWPCRSSPVYSDNSRHGHIDPPGVRWSIRARGPSFGYMRSKIRGRRTGSISVSLVCFGTFYAVGMCGDLQALSSQFCRHLVDICRDVRMVEALRAEPRLYAGTAVWSDLWVCVCLGTCAHL